MEKTPLQAGLYAFALLGGLCLAGSSLATYLPSVAQLASELHPLPTEPPRVVATPLAHADAASRAPRRQLRRELLSGVSDPLPAQMGSQQVETPITEPDNHMGALPRGRAHGRGGRGRGRGAKSRGRGGRGKGRGKSAIAQLPLPAPAAEGSCAEADEALLHGSGCSLSSPEGCPTRYIMLRVHGNDKFLAPREQGVVYAAVRARFRNEGSMPLQRIAWKIIPKARGYVQLQHVLTGKFLRIVPPPDPISWCFVVEADPTPYGKQTWFQLQTGDGREVDLSSSYDTVHLRAHATGAYLNYRTEDFVRGHGNAMRGGAWPPADRLPSTRLQLVSLRLADLAADIDRWAERKRACLAPCENATAAVEGAKAGRVVWQEHCWKHYAEPLCNAMARAQRVLLGRSWGGLPPLAQMRWARMDCEKYVSAEATQRLIAPGRALPPPPLRPVMDIIPSLQPGGVHCVAPVEGVLLLAVADRPNQFLCHFFNSALRHKLKPLVLGWNPASWLDASRKPWTYHLGAKLLLPLHYLQQCAPPKDTLVVFTDQDVVFQGGYDELKRAYASASAAAGGAPLIFSTEKESYPLELQGLYPKVGGGVFEFLNSGMWAGPVSAATELLGVMTAVNRGGQPLLEQLMRHYVNWGRLNTKVEKVPAAFLENDQTKYAGLFVAQSFADTCRSGGHQVQLRGHGCFVFLHDGKRRCSHGKPECSRGAGDHALPSRIALDRKLALFENMYHAGPHRVVNGKIVNGRSGLAPIVVHFNGPAKVSFERDWHLPWDATAGQTPVHFLLRTQRAAFSDAEREAAMDRFESDVTFLDPLFRHVADPGPYRFQCEA